LGYWSDKSGGKFRRPYLLSIAVAALGGLIYFIAGAFTGPTAIGLIFLGRLLGGVGAANQTLGYSYVAQVIPRAQLTRSSALLSMVRVLGMAVAPGLNIFMAKVHGSIPLTPNVSIELTPLNTVGMFLFLSNSLSFVIIYFMLHEPPESTKPPASVDEVDSKGWKFWKSLLSLDILIPIMSVFTLNVSFQLLETGLAPAANDALGFGPTAISAIFGLNSILIFCAIIVTIVLSAKGKQLKPRTHYYAYVFACACPLFGKNNVRQSHLTPSSFVNDTRCYGRELAHDRIALFCCWLHVHVSHVGGSYHYLAVLVTHLSSDHGISIHVRTDTKHLYQDCRQQSKFNVSSRNVAGYSEHGGECCRLCRTRYHCRFHLAHARRGRGE
jgi:hypothetical protein